jgi:hypothetical protein
LDNYEKEEEEKRPGISFRKEFYYPPVLPIVFYDGPDTWTAKTNFRDRTALNGVFQKYIPSFEYELVDLKKYNVQDIIRFNDMLSLVMLIDLTGTVDGIERLRELPKDYLKNIGLQIPEGLTKLLKDVVTVMLNRFQLPEDEIGEITGYIDKREMKMMFEALVERYLTAREEGREEGRAEERETAHREKLEGARKQKQSGVPPEIITAGFGLSPEEIENL